MTVEYRACLCGAPTKAYFAQGHDARHAGELALAVHRGALPESEALALLPTPKITAKFAETLSSRREGNYRGELTTWGDWLEQLIDE